MGYGGINPLHPKGGGRGRNDRRGAYNHRKWRRIRRRKLAHNPLCELCLIENRVRPAEVIHHLVEHAADPVKFFVVSLADLQSLCREHHEKLHGRVIEREWIDAATGWPVSDAAHAPSATANHAHGPVGMYWEDDDEGDGLGRD
jgi:5-methylcytosine-specific restriction protein A